MSLSTFDKTQTQYERKMARQRQLDAMEAAAAGKLIDSDMMSTGSRDSSGTGGGSSSSTAGAAVPKTLHKSVHNPPDGAVENARRFLWDEDEKDYNIPSRMFGGKEDSIPTQRRGLVGAGDRKTGSSGRLHDVRLGGSTKELGSGSARGAGLTGVVKGLVAGLPHFGQHKEEEEDLNRNISPFRHSDDAIDAAGMRDASAADDYLQDVELHGLGRRRGGAAFGTIRARCGECCQGSRRLRKRILVASSVIVLIIVIVAAVLTSKNNNDEGGSGETSDSTKDVTTGTTGTTEEDVDFIRYDAIRELILESKYSIQSDLDTPGTPQSMALYWIVGFDPAKLPIDDDMLLQRYALATFFFATYVESELRAEAPGPNGTLLSPDAGWVVSDHWMTEKGICVWAGIYCMPHLHEGTEEYHYNDNNAVIHFNLTDNSIEGTIPREIAALEDLVSLDLSRNKLRGSIPTEIGRLDELVNLYLIDNEITGSIPPTVGHLASVRNFHLGTNKLTGPVPPELAELTSLRALGLDENYFTGTIPSILNNLEHLIILYLDDNLLTGTIPGALGELTNLSDLRLRKNKLSGSIPTELGNLKHLGWLLKNTGLSILTDVQKNLRGIYQYHSLELVA